MGRGGDHDTTEDTTSTACFATMNSGGGTGAAGAGFVNVKGGKLVKGEESQPIRSLVLLKKGGGTTPVIGRRNWLSREFELYSNVLT